ncbi:DUF2752 domain-containing protein [Streptomyces sp. NPDC018045]|uniref:DUF2752 domain-containing protein n=1 Tax=Streptomyces sp. NPDC018045 TaxID=3365037 RepID=UPI00379F7A88
MSEPVAPAGGPVSALARRRRMSGPARRMAAPLGVLAAVVASFAFVALVDPNEPGHYPACPLLARTGIHCPACGGLRSAHAVAHGDLATAAGANLLAVAGYAAFALFWVAWTVRAARGLPTAGPRPGAVHWWALGGLLLVFTVVRNLPFAEGLTP